MALHPASFDDHIFRLLIEAVDDYAIYIIDAQGHILTWNSGAERNAGYAAEEVIGQSFELFYTPEDLANKLPTGDCNMPISLVTMKHKAGGFVRIINVFGAILPLVHSMTQTMFCRVLSMSPAT